MTEKQKFWRTTLLFVVVVSLSSAFMYFIGIEQLKALVRDYGLIGFFLLITAMNVAIQPVSPDFVIAGSPFFLEHHVAIIAVVSAVAGIVSGLIDYSLGRAVGLTGFEKFFGRRNTEVGVRVYKRFGIWGIVISTVTPVPYSVVCWMAGIFSMSFWRFLLAVSLTRAPRHALVAWYCAKLATGG